MVVPEVRENSSQRRIFPPAISTAAPVVSSAARVSSNSRETEAMEGRASPRNPRVAMESRSFTSLSLLVAWRSKASSASSRSMPLPLSATRIRRRPPLSISMRRSVAPASSEFSMSSFTTDAGRSTTSPAAILLATLSERTRILPMNWQLLSAHGGKELSVAARFAQFVQQQFHAFHRRQRIQHAAQHEDSIELFLGDQQFFLARSALGDIDGGEDALVHQLAIQMDFHVAGAFEFFKDHVIHAAAGVDQCRCHDG